MDLSGEINWNTSYIIASYRLLLASFIISCYQGAPFDIQYAHELKMGSASTAFVIMIGSRWRLECLLYNTTLLRGPKHQIDACEWACILPSLG